MIMKTQGLFHWIAPVFIVAMIIGNVGSIKAQGCNNGGLEDGTLDNWQCKMYNNANGYIDLGSEVLGAVAGQHEVVTSGSDPNVPALSQTYEGSNALKLGDLGGGNEVASANYAFTVSSANPVLKFYYAFVLDNPSGHSSLEKPFFSYVITKEADFAVPPLYNYIDGEAHRITLKNIKTLQYHENFAYTDWRYVCIDLSDYIGEEVSIQFSAADCSLGGHGGYAYIDGLCSEDELSPILNGPDEVCLGDDISVFPGFEGLYSAGFVMDYRVDAQLIKDGRPVGDPVTVDQGSNSLIDEITISDKFVKFFFGQQFECGDQIKFTFTVEDCNGSKQVEKTVTVVCPEADAGPDRILCCESFGQSVTLGTSGVSGYTYHWEDEDGNTVGSTAQITLVPPKTQTYYLTVSNVDACSGVDEVEVVYLSTDMEVNLSQYGPVMVQDPNTGELCPSDIYLLTGFTFPETCDGLGPDNMKEMLSIKSLFNYQWSSGVTNGGDVGQVPNEAGTYSVTVSENTCNISVTDDITVEPCPTLTGVIPTDDIVFPTSFTPDGDGQNDVWNAVHIGFGNDPAYNATRYRFRVWSAWGTVIVDYQDYALECQGFENVSVPNWDGTTNSGWLLPLDVYPFRLEFWNCSGNYGMIEGSITPQPGN